MASGIKRTSTTGARKNSLDRNAYDSATTWRQPVGLVRFDMNARWSVIRFQQKHQQAWQSITDHTVRPTLVNKMLPEAKTDNLPCPTVVSSSSDTSRPSSVAMDVICGHGHTSGNFNLLANSRITHIFWQTQAHNFQTLYGSNRFLDINRPVNAWDIDNMRL